MEQTQTVTSGYVNAQMPNSTGATYTFKDSVEQQLEDALAAYRAAKVAPKVCQCCCCNCACKRTQPYYQYPPFTVWC